MSKYSSLTDTPLSLTVATFSHLPPFLRVSPTPARPRSFRPRQLSEQPMIVLLRTPLTSRKKDRRLSHERRWWAVLPKP